MALNTQTTNAFYVRPIRGITGPNFLYYNNTNGEITYSPFVSGQLINTKLITESINPNSFLGLNPQITPGVIGDTEIASGNTRTIVLTTLFQIQFLQIVLFLSTLICLIIILGVVKITLLFLYKTRVVPQYLKKFNGGTARAAAALVVVRFFP